MIAQWRAAPVIARELRQYRARLVPWLWYLGHSTDCRIFQNLNVPEIIEQVFKTFEFADYEMWCRAGTIRSSSSACSTGKRLNSSAG